VTAHPKLDLLRSELERELTERILPFWMTRAVDERNGGFLGYIDGEGVSRPAAPKGSVLNARILWTFSAAYRVLGDPAYRATADRAIDYFRLHFIDPVRGGVRWMVDAHGMPADERKYVYAQAFGIYALAEHHRATRDAESLQQAIELHRLIERHGYDDRHGGYHEAFSRDWELLEDVRLSEEDAAEAKSMNTHLHLLEAYSSLYRVWPDAQLRERLARLVALFAGTIIPSETGHAISFFDEEWTPKSTVVSYGHDIEASWLLLEAADVLGDRRLRERALRVSLRVAAATLGEGADSLGGIYVSQVDRVVDTDKEWWPQAEAIVGFVNAYQVGGGAEFLDAAVATWEFTKHHLLDMKNGEWHRRVSRDGALRPGHEKIGPWKCPYHTSRACLEVMERSRALEPAAARAS
jgi:mannobiose 2-epimerase